MPTTNRRPTVDGALEALADDRRLLVVEYVQDLEEPVHVETIAAHLAERTSTGVSALAASLHHAHLPKLHGAGLLRYDPEDNTVTPPGGLGDVRGLTRLLAEVDESVSGG